MKKLKDSLFQELLDSVLNFRKERDWEQFHNPKDSAIALSLEAAEVLEHFQWKDKEEMKAHIEKKRKEIGDELSDVLFWVLLMAYDLNIDLGEAFKSKMKENEKKYPVEKARGKKLKYTEL